MDPFNAVRDEVEKALLRLEQAAQAPPTSDNVSASLAADADAVADDLAEMARALDAVAARRERFDLSDEQLAERHAFVRASDAALARCRAALERSADERRAEPQPVKRKAKAAARRGEERESLLASTSSSVRRAAEQVDSRNRETLSTHATLQQEQLVRQDAALDGIGAAVGRLKQMGGAINDELRSQTRMLDDLEDQVDGASDSMAALREKMRAMLPARDTRLKLTVVCLTVLLLVLVSLVLN